MSEDVLEALRAMCLAFPEATEQEAWGQPTFRAGGKIFVFFTVTPTGAEPASCWCKAPPGMQEGLVSADPARYFVPPYLGGNGWIGIRLSDGCDWEEVAALVHESYCLVAPKRLVARLGDV